MKLIDVEHKRPPFDVASGLATALLATGTVEEYVDAGTQQQTPVANTIWTVHPSKTVQRLPLSPYVRAECIGCGAWMVEGTRVAMIERVAVLAHTLACTGGREKIPPNIFKLYKRLREEWEGPITKEIERARIINQRDEEQKEKVARDKLIFAHKVFLKEQVYA